VNTADTAYFQVRATATAQRLKLLRVVVAIQVAPTTAPVFYVARSTAIGTVTTTLAGQPFDTADSAAKGTLDSAFSVAPTFTTGNKMDVGPMAVTAGGGWVFDFRDSPLVIPDLTTAGIVIVNANASGATTGTFSCAAQWQE
jgi:hypothetical protein